MCKFLGLTGLWVMPEGNVILVGNERLEVAVACNGLSMLMSLAATVAATASLVPMVTLEAGPALVEHHPDRLDQQRPPDRRDGLVLLRIWGRGRQASMPTTWPAG